MSFTRQSQVILFLSCAAICSCSQAGHAEEKRLTRVIFFGDSITEIALKPNGYITRMKATLGERGLGDRFELIGSGLSGDKIYDLYFRLDEDVLARNPDVVVIWVGVNDVWHKEKPRTGTDPDKFEKFYGAIVRKLQARRIKVVLCTPMGIGERTAGNPQDEDLDKYAEIVRSLARKYESPLIDLRSAFRAYNALHNKDNRESGILTYDRVHPNDEGNNLIAGEMMRVRAPPVN